jgi:hypothetical protein
MHDSAYHTALFATIKHPHPLSISHNEKFNAVDDHFLHSFGENHEPRNKQTAGFEI